MNKKLTYAIILVQPVIIFYALTELTHDQKYVWRGMAIVIGISIVMGSLVAFLKKSN